MKKTLPSIKCEEETIENMKAAIKKFNKKSLVEMSIQEFRRIGYELLAQMILQDRELPIKISEK